jgi:Calx-beta domain
MRGLGSRLVVIGLAASAVLGVPATSAATGSLCGPRSVSATDVTASENADLMIFTVTGNGCAAGTVQFQVVSGAAPLAPANAPGDFLASSGQIGWTAGEVASKTIAVPLVDDFSYEPDEGLTLNLSAPVGLSIVDGSGRGVIIDDEAPGILVAMGEPLCQMETCPQCWVRVALDRPARIDVSVRVVTSGGTAQRATDYVPVDTRVTIPAGATQARIAVPFRNDTLAEPTEYIIVSIMQPSVGHITGGYVRALIEDDDAPGFAGPDGRLP